MNIKYQTYNNPETPLYISKELQKLRIGELKRDTIYMFQVIKHPEREEWAIAIDLDYLILLYPQANITTLLDFFKEKITPDEKTKFEKMFQQGGRVKMSDIMPAVNTAELKTSEGLEADKWFDTGETL